MSTKQTITNPRKAGRQNGAPKIQGKKVIKKEEEMTADELVLKAWKKTYANRHHRLDA